MYDSVPELIEEDSLEEKMSFGAEYDTSEAGNSPPPPLPITPPPYTMVIENKEKPKNDLTTLKKLVDSSNKKSSLNKLIPELIEKATEKTVIFTSSQVRTTTTTNLSLIHI